MKNVVKDFASANRLNEAYRHLYANFGIDSQIKFAEALRVQRTAEPSRSRSTMNGTPTTRARGNPKRDAASRLRLFRHNKKESDFTDLL